MIGYFTIRQRFLSRPTQKNLFNINLLWKSRDVRPKVWPIIPDMRNISLQENLMQELISQGLLLLAEIGVIVVMLIIIARERKKVKEREKKNKRSLRNSSVAKSEVVYLD